MLTSIDASTTKTSAKPLYLLLAITGSILPWYWLLQDPTVLLPLCSFNEPLQITLLYWRRVIYRLVRSRSFALLGSN